MARVDGYGADFFFYDINEIAQNLQNKQIKIPDKIDGKIFTLRFTGEKMLILANTAVLAVSLADMYEFASEGGDDLFDPPPD